MTKGRIFSRLSRGALLAIGIAAFTAPVAQAAPGQLFWTNLGNDAIGHASFTGTTPSGVNQSFIPAAGADPCGVTVTATHIYWVNQPGANGAIGRANLNGSGADSNFISGAAVDPSACGIAVNGTHIFWGNYGQGVGRATLNGGSADPDFIPNGVGQVFDGVAITATRLYVSDPTSEVIRSFGITGGDEVILPGVGEASGVAVDGANVYWGGGIAIGTTTLGRADLALSPGSLNNSFITGGNFPIRPAVDATSVYWANFGTSSIGRTPLGGGAATPAFIPAMAPSGVAVIPETAEVPAVPPGKATLGKLTKDKKKGTASLEVNLPRGGKVEVGGAGVKPQTKSPSVDGPIAMPIKATGKKRKQLRSKGKAKITIEVTYTPTAAPLSGPEALSLTTKLKKKL